MLLPCNLYVYHEASLTKEEIIYASVSIGSLYDNIMLYYDEKAIFVC